MAINLSTRQLRDPRLVDRVADSLVRHDLDPGALVLEITESVLLDDGPRPRDAIAGLRRLGVGVAIDDFGTGFSSLAYLSRMPVDELKIDRSFVAALGTDGRSTAIVKAMIAMAHALDLRVVAEGVERSEQFERLRDMGCDYAQGHLWSRPRKPTGLARWVRARAEITRSLPPG
jgi:EAL domain-containing protein (putative c-di-GMP-specific phosphodiesterase class I)